MDLIEIADTENFACKMVPSLFAHAKEDPIGMIFPDIALATPKKGRFHVILSGLFLRSMKRGVIWK